MTIRWGIIGAGRIARAFADALAQSNRGELISIGSRDMERGKAFADDYGLDQYDTHDAILAADNIDAVYIATPHTDHAQQAIAALGFGKHVLCEKPLSESIASAEKMVKTAKRTKRTLAVMFQRRFEPAIAKAIEI